MVQGVSTVQVGRVTAVYWGDRLAGAVALAELADAAGPWPGIDAVSASPIRLILAPGGAEFDSLTRHRLPEWGAGAAFPGSNTIVLNLAAGRPRRLLRHELAHLALHEQVGRVPRWFDEGYAARAADEWHRFDALRVNWTLVRGAVPTLGEVDRHLRAGPAGRAEAAYALAMTAVALLERIGGERGLAPLIAALADGATFDEALRVAFKTTADQFEAQWRRDVRHRYGWLLLLTSFSAFWAVAGALLIVLWYWRRQRNRRRRADLEDGWASADDAGVAGESPDSEGLELHK